MNEHRHIQSSSSLGRPKPNLTGTKKPTKVNYAAPKDSKKNWTNVFNTAKVGKAISPKSGTGSGSMKKVANTTVTKDQNKERQSRNIKVATAVSANRKEGASSPNPRNADRKHVELNAKKIAVHNINLNVFSFPSSRIVSTTKNKSGKSNIHK